MTSTEISAEYVSRYHVLTEQVGRRLGVNDPQFWELENWYMREHQTLISARPVIREERPVKAVKPATPAVQRMPPPPASVKAPTSSAPRLCACGNEITKKPGRGRYPSRCATCRGV